MDSSNSDFKEHQYILKNSIIFKQQEYYTVVEEFHYSHEA